MRIATLAGALVVCVVLLAGVALGDYGDDLGPVEAVRHADSARLPAASCQDSIAGKALRPKRGRELFAGPIAFAGLVSRNGLEIADDRDYFEREPGKRYTGFKAGAIVTRGEVVTLIVPHSERPELKIDYALGHRPGFINRLEACADRRTGFPGGFEVHGPLCTKLRIRVEGRAVPITKPVSFGAGRCR